MITPELAQEFEARTSELLRSRFLWFSGILSILGVSSLLIAGVLAVSGADLINLVFGVTPQEGGASVARRLAALSIIALGVGVYVACFIIARTRRLPRERLLRLTFALVVCDGLIQVVGVHLPLVGDMMMGVWGFAITHFLACCFLPWTVRQAIQPLVPVLAVWFILKLALGDAPWSVRVMQVTLGPMLFLPGIGLCYWRHTRRAEQFEKAYLYRRYRDVRRELYDAQRIHEALFPRPVLEGPVRMTYRYEPMQQIGGDYCFAFQSQVRLETTPSDLFSIVLLDVTGHGILAALTVNRIYGELSRIFAERPGARPDEVLRALNHYTHLTLSPHAVYVTALCACVDVTRDRLLYSNGGHPPAYIRRADGSVEELASTTFLLGACPDHEFEPGCVETALRAGDAFVAYTDGVIEARGIDGKQWGLQGIRSVVRDPAGAPNGWADRIIDEVARYRVGPAADDTLVIEVLRHAVDGASESRMSSRKTVLVGA